MLTGRDLIIYILQNNLEDAPIFDNNKLIGFMTVEEAAIKFSVGTMTIRLWVALGHLNALRIGDELFIPMNAKLIFKREE